MTLSYKNKNFASASIFARKLLDLNPPTQISQQVQKLQQICDQTPIDNIKLNYDQYNPFVICSSSFEPIYKDNSCIKCCFCGASYKNQFNGKLCQICQVSKIGLNGTGLRNHLN
jgi:coatomer protein complex subunit alpha (xenin)